MTTDDTDPVFKPQLRNVVPQPSEHVDGDKYLSYIQQVGIPSQYPCFDLSAACVLLE